MSLCCTDVSKKIIFPPFGADAGDILQYRAGGYLDL